LALGIRHAVLTFHGSKKLFKKRKTLPVLVIALVSPLAATAQDGVGCAKIEDNARRLHCYDSAFRTSASVSNHSAWVVSEETSKISDRKNVTAFIESANTLRGRFGDKPKATLILRCREKVIDAYVVFGGHFMSSHREGAVTYRVDKRPAKTKEFTNSNDHKALGLWGGGSAIPFIRELLGGVNLFVQATPMNESSVTAEFPLTGIEDAVRPISETCGWTEKNLRVKGKTDRSGE
jgi:type VI secretion system protein VasI